jgi:hypothetical protein
MPRGQKHGARRRDGHGKMNKTHGDDWISRAILEEKGSTRLIGRRRPGT